MRFIAFLVATFLVVVSPAQSHTSEEFMETVEQVKQSIVVVRASHEDNIIAGSPLDIYLGKRPDRTPSTLGTGFVVAGQHIGTNYHVISGATSIHVRFEDENTEYVATVIGADEFSDIAVLKIEKSAPEIQWSSSKFLKQGQDVWAIGHPRGFTYTVSKGIVSHTNRRVGDTLWQSAIQTDVAINQGNSGGPLLDMDGNVVGVNTAIISASGGSDGLSFSVDSDYAKYIVNTLIEHGEVERPFIGMYMGREVGEDFVEIVEVQGPAKEAGLQKDDVIMLINGISIRIIPDVYDILQYSKPGDELKFIVSRGDTIHEVVVTLGTLTEEKLDALRQK